MSNKNAQFEQFAVQKLQESLGDTETPMDFGVELPADARAKATAVVESRPMKRPRNPYSFRDQPDLHAAWQVAAEDAGINDLYHNGQLVVLK